MVLKPLTGLRGLAALVVFLAHYAYNAQVPAFNTFYYIFFWHSEAVDFFFVLSGFVLCYAYSVDSNNINWKKYITARISRVYPLYLFSLLFVSALGFLAALKRGYWASDLLFEDFIRQLFMVNAFPLIGTGRHWNFPAWSISVEFFLYLFVFPIAVYISRVSNSFIMITSIIFFSFLSYGVHNNFFGEMTWLDQVIFRGIFGFLSGSIVYLFYKKKRKITDFFQKKGDLFFLFFLVVVLFSGYGKLSFSLLIFLFPALVLSLTAEESLSAKFFATSGMVFLGDISYSIYLFHIPISKFLLGIYSDFSSDHPMIWVLLTLFLVISSSALLYTKLELPAKRIFAVRIASILDAIPKIYKNA
ncbi:acyltransferase 3 [Chloroherpeton thalassium ATCC 35110]|uniref:Acyltransferase 3 n=1 Tax=Chloroherpeton thalassium (strain ATCC 35110 / GB-78) TaxID=517418 RepID=B3QUZ1_CHLT3|nr:acyltransferase [Chloroherpeton thalassium]ACF14492.1 acyltransferase 3 [Chloroherpeton thalassium ATCC 35110]